MDSTCRSLEEGETYATRMGKSVHSIVEQVKSIQSYLTLMHLRLVNLPQDEFDQVLT